VLLELAADNCRANPNAWLAGNNQAGKSSLNYVIYKKPVKYWGFKKYFLRNTIPPLIFLILFMKIG